MKYKIELEEIISTIMLISFPLLMNSFNVSKEFKFIIYFLLTLYMFFQIAKRFFSLYNIKEKRYIEEINEKYEKIKISVIPEKSDPEQNADILKLMLANMREINEYYELSKIQAQNSFTLAVVMCIIGILLMGISIFAAFFQSSNLISAVIPAVGAAIVEVIAGTSLIVYKNSLSQLNRYFNSLHSNERFLSIVNIVSKASPEVQDDMYFEIIKSQIGVVSTDLVEDKSEESKVK